MLSLPVALRCRLLLLAPFWILVGCGNSDPGVDQIYVHCDGVAYAPSARAHDGPSGLVFHAPESWSRWSDGVNVDYTPTDFARVSFGVSRVADAAAAQRQLDEHSPYGATQVRHFALGGRPAVASLRQFRSARPESAERSPYEGMDLVLISLGVVRQEEVAWFEAFAPASARASTFCELQSTLASVRW